MHEVCAAPAATDVQALLGDLRCRFSAQLGERLAGVRRRLQTLVAGAWSPEAAVVLHREVHGLTGAAGTFGLTHVSDAARQLEALLAPLSRGELVPSAVHWQALADALAQLEQAADQPPPGVVREVTPALLWPSAPVPLTIHLVQADAQGFSDLQAGLAAAGYRVCVFGDRAALERARAAAAPDQPAVVVLDLATPAEVEPALAWVRGQGAGLPPVIAALPSDDLGQRLLASRAGIRRTLARPLDPARLVDLLDTISGRQPPQPYRVLLVDDDPLLLQAQAAVLSAAGMSVHSLSQPLQTLAELDRFQPDVLLLDVYMPEASGPELAAALREREAYFDLPVLFLSAETDLTQQLLALNLGGDDFLVKPVQPDHLVAAVTARARRARQSMALRRRLQTTLYEREREHLALDQHAIVSIADPLGHITYANDLFCSASGYRRDEVLGLNHLALRSDVNPPGFVRGIRSAILAGQVWQGEVGCRRRDGGLYWTETTVTPFLNAEGELYQYVSIQTDISHIKAAEAALRAQRDMQRVISLAAAALMAAPLGRTGEAVEAALAQSGRQLGADRAYLFTFSRDGSHMNSTHVWQAPGLEPLNQPVRRAPLDLIPWMRERFLGDAVLQIPDVNAMPTEAASEQALLQRNRVRSLIAFPLQRESRPFGFLAYSVERQQRDWTTEEVDLLKVLSDVIASALARQWADAALRKSESRLNFLVSSSPVTIYTSEPQPPFAPVYISPNVEQFMGFAPAALIGDPGFIAGLVHPEDLWRVAQERPLVLEQGSHLQEYRLRMSDGQYRWVHDQRRLVRDAAGEPLEVIGYWMDITERKRIEGELFRFNHELEQRVIEQTRSVIESERFARATLDALSARVVILDAAGNILAANRAWNEFSAGAQPREGANYLAFCENAVLHADQSLAPLAAGIRAVMAGQLRNFVHEYALPLSTDPHWFLCHVERFAGDGELRTVVSHEDITQMKLAERQQLRSQRLESLGTLAGGVAHDLNNALAPVLMGMSILKDQYPEESRLFEMIQGSAQRGADMVRQLLTFARGAEGERVAVCPSQVVHELERLMKGSFPKNIQLLVHNDDMLPAVVGDPTQLHQVLLNLCVNARDAMPGGGTLSVRVQVVELDAVYARSIPDAVPGRYVALRVSDTGSGIPPDILDRIFDPFFTTKGADKGTGLGLSTVLGIVKGHGGFVQVYSHSGAGTTFTVYLPAAAPEARAAALAPAVEASEPGQGHGETILFVDDEAAVREVGRTVLERLNYQPLTATDGADGLVQAAEHRGTLRAVITDLHMPHMDGMAFVRALRRMLPDVPVVVASGRVDESLVAELKLQGITRRLDKPFTEAQLARQLQELLAPR